MPYGSIGSSGGGVTPPVLGLSAGEDLAINDAVMVDAADSQIWKCTVAKGGQVIGIMKAAILSGFAVTSDSIAFSGEIVDAIVGVAIVRGDRLSVQVTTGRLGPLNSALHTHVAFRIATGTAGIAATSKVMVVSEGSVGAALVEGGRKAALASELATGAGSNNLTCTTSSTGPTTGLVIAKALETNAVVGTTIKVLVI